MPKHEIVASGPDDVLPPTSVAEALHALGAASYRWTPADDVVLWSAAAEAVLGPERLPLALRGSDYAELIEPGSGPSRQEAALRARHLGVAPSGDDNTRFFETIYCLALPPGNGRRRLWVEDRGLCHFSPEGDLIRVDGFLRRLAVGRPVRIRAGRGSEPKTDRQRLAQLLDEWLSLAYDGDGEFGFVLVGIDRLGDLNDAYGFLVSDEVIDVVWLRLRAQLGEDEEIARFSGSKFGLLLRLRPGEDLACAAQRFLNTVNATPPRTSAGAVAATVSAGGLIAPRQGRAVAEIFSRGQDALQRARRTARGTLCMYSSALDRAAERHANVRFADDIVDALDHGRVSLAFQPIACGRTREVTFHECLVRITGRDGREHDGASIIPTADRFGLTRLVDGRAMELALDALRADAGVKLSVNVSPGSIHDGAWMRRVEEAARSGLSDRLIIEITESATIPDIQVMGERIAWLHGHGCRVAMDDFGVGYTSFRNLRALKVDMLKIDGSFIATMMESEEDRHFVRMLLDLSGQLEIETVAEWVLDEATGRQLVDWGCTYLQGELIGLPSDSPVPVAR